MKVTALIEDELVKDVIQLSHGKNITESLTIALKEWAHLKHIHDLNAKVRKNPLQFAKGLTAESIRKVNRK